MLSDERKQQVLALGRLGWSLRKIEAATGIRRETAGAYLRAASIAIRAPRQVGLPSKPATAGGVSTDSEPSKPASSEVVSTDCTAAKTPWPPPGGAPAASACEPYREIIERAVGLGRNAMAIYQDLVSEHGLRAKYASVRRFVARLRAQKAPEAHVVIHTEAGQEGQVDYGEGPMVRQPETGKYRRTRLFVFTLGHSRKSIRLISFRSSSRIWAELHERAFRRLGGAPRVVVPLCPGIAAQPAPRSRKTTRAIRRTGRGVGDSPGPPTWPDLRSRDHIVSSPLTTRPLARVVCPARRTPPLPQFPPRHQPPPRRPPLRLSPGPPRPLPNRPHLRLSAAPLPRVEGSRPTDPLTFFELAWVPSTAEEPTFTRAVRFLHGAMMKASSSPVQA
jgi:transposase